ncbi:MAG: alcohol dehydrogenase catalytic domain-containing protein [Spirochaetaceae bacterium]|jgi:L-iditol 2-dehydrogenase|nr:alcohol dehydrogenase catalytic domain-containing protein [Spirochaetaceae bacterium]
MKQVRITSPYSFKVEYAEPEEPEESEALLKVEMLGICASDMQIYHGKHKFMRFPVILGHEAAAVIEKTGARVSGFTKGDYVTVQPQVYCGTCYPCGIGRFNVCENLSVIGVHRDGLSREYITLDTKYLHKCPSSMPLEHITLVEPCAVAVGAVRRAARLEGAKVAVVGAGTIGNLTAQAAKAMGASQVLVADISGSKLEYAAECGADFCVNTGKTRLKDAISAAFGRERSDIIIDCAATPAVFASILEAARQCSEIIITGNYKEPAAFDVPLLQRQEITMKGHMMYVREDFSTAISLLAGGKIATAKTVNKIFSFNEYESAFQYAGEHANEIMKLMIKL